MFRGRKGSQINNPSFHLEKLGKTRKSKANRRKERKVRAEINDIWDENSRKNNETEN